MSSYIQQISVTDSLIQGCKFPEMYEAVQKEASKSEWDNYGTVNKVRKAKTFPHICKAMGIYLIYEGNDLFTVDVDGTYVSSFLVPMILSIEKYINDGEVFVQIENRRMLFVFQNGQAFTSEMTIEELARNRAKIGRLP